MGERKGVGIKLPTDRQEENNHRNRAHTHTCVASAAGVVRGPDFLSGHSDGSLHRQQHEEAADIFVSVIVRSMECSA